MRVLEHLQSRGTVEGWRPRWGRTRLLAALRTFLTVAVITLLLWIWADLERESHETVTVPVKVLPLPGSGLRVASPTEPVSVRFTLTGPKERLVEFTRWLDEQGAAGKPGVYEVQTDPDWRTDGNYSINVPEALSRWEPIRGLIPSDPTPQTIGVRVDRWVPVEAKVELWTSDNAAVRDPAVTPERVTVRVPSSRLAELGDSPVIRTQEIKLDEYAPGQEVRKERVPLAMAILVPSPGGPRSVEVRTAEPSEVTASFRVVRPTAWQDFSVNVQVLAPPDLLERIAREGLLLERRDPDPLGEWRLNLRVRGSTEAIQKALADPAAIRAFVRISDADFLETGTYPPTPVTVVLPPGLELESPTAPTVSFRFVPSRPAAMPTTPPVITPPTAPPILPTTTLTPATGPA